MTYLLGLLYCPLIIFTILLLNSRFIYRQMLIKTGHLHLTYILIVWTRVRTSTPHPPPPPKNGHPPFLELPPYLLSRLPFSVTPYQVIFSPSHHFTITPPSTQINTPLSLVILFCILWIFIKIADVCISIVIIAAMVYYWFY